MAEVENSIEKETVQSMIDPLMSTLRSIKDMELQWVEKYTIVTLPVIGYLVISNPSNGLSKPLLSGIIVGYFFFTLWFQDVLRKERRSYYRVLRTLLRAQNYLGLYKIKFLAEPFADAAFPKGLGVNKGKDGTQPYSSFLHRQIYTVVIFLAIISACIYQNGDVAFSLFLVPLDVAWLFYVFRLSKTELYKEAKSEEGLAGADPKWFD